MAFNDRIIDGQWIGGGVVGSGCGLIWGISLHLLGGAEENHESGWDSLCPGQDLNWALPKCKFEVSHKPACSMKSAEIIEIQCFAYN